MFLSPFSQLSHRRRIDFSRRYEDIVIFFVVDEFHSLSRSDGRKTDTINLKTQTPSTPQWAANAAATNVLFLCCGVAGLIQRLVNIRYP